MKNKQAQENNERTRLEDQMASSAPLAFELQAAGQAMVELIKKAPTELQPAALAAALEIINGFRMTAGAVVEELPDYPPSLSTKRIEMEAHMYELLYKNLPPGTTPDVFLPALRLLFDVDEMVDPLADEPPTIPHQLSPSLINSQAEMLIEYVTRKALS